MTHRERILRALHEGDASGLGEGDGPRRGRPPQRMGHKVVPDFSACGMEGLVDRGIGIYRLPCVPYRVELPPSVEREMSTVGDFCRVTYHTPMGDLSVAFGFTEEMRVEPDYGGFLKWKEEVGEDGLAVARRIPYAGDAQGLYGDDAVHVGALRLEEGVQRTGRGYGPLLRGAHKGGGREPGRGGALRG